MSGRRKRLGHKPESEVGMDVETVPQRRGRGRPKRETFNVNERRKGLRMEEAEGEEPTELAITMDTTLSNLETDVSSPASNKLTLDNEALDVDDEDDDEMSNMLDGSGQLVERTCSDQSLVKSVDSYSAATDSGVTSPELSHRGVSPGHGAQGSYVMGLVDGNQYEDDGLMAVDCNNGSDPICSLCCCGERSLLGQGDLLRFESTPGFNPFRKPLPRSRRNYEDDALYDPNERSQKHLTWRRARGPPKSQQSRDRSKSPRRGNPDSVKDHIVESLDELSRVGHSEDPDLQTLFEPSGHTTAHHCCAAWSDGVCQNENFQLLNVDKAVFSGITQRCTYCHRFGATIFCMEQGCNRVYHYPCAASSGSFQGIKSLILLCPEHLDLAEERVEMEELECAICDMPGNLSESLFCTSCGQHYHGSCLDPPVSIDPVVRAGWQCPNCKICQTCRQPGDDNKMLVCDTCDKGYHTFCLKPAMITIPKNGWKCKMCRMCTDCGSRTPGNGPSSRWHHNYTVCDSCYQQRNKGYCCPICFKAYRHHTTHKVMVQCHLCNRYVHADCDDKTVITNHQQGKRTPYKCPDCRHRPPRAIDLDRRGSASPLDDGRRSPGYASSSRTPPHLPIPDDVSQDMSLSASSVQEDSLSLSSIDTDYNMAWDDKKPEQEFSASLSASSGSLSMTIASVTRHHGGGKPLDRLSQIERMGRRRFSGRPRGRGSNSYAAVGRRRRHGSNVVKRGPKPRIKIAALPPQSPPPSSEIVPMEPVVVEKPSAKEKDDDDTSMHTTVVLFSVDDKFTATQDMCLSCGSFGLGSEGRLLTCSQCGQCYHPYCVNIKITKVVLSKGWRCLDCTVCEGCGKSSDEARLLLCDDCDISYHTYCLDPPLQTVPKGGWKCKWCVCCTHCGSVTPGENADWMNNSPSVGPAPA